MTIVHCCLGMQFAIREHLFVVRQELPLFDSGSMTVPRLMVIVAFCPWCGKEIQLVADNDRRGER